jgi:hypothetical protein
MGSGVHAKKNLPHQLLKDKASLQSRKLVVIPGTQVCDLCAQRSYTPLHVFLSLRSLMRNLHSYAPGSLDSRSG